MKLKPLKPPGPQIKVLKSEMRSGFSALVPRSKMQYFVVTYPRPARSPPSVSELRNWKKKVVSCSIVEDFLAAKRRLTDYFCMFPPAAMLVLETFKFGLYSLLTGVEYWLYKLELVSEAAEGTQFVLQDERTIAFLARFLSRAERRHVSVSLFKKFPLSNIRDGMLTECGAELFSVSTTRTSGTRHNCRFVDLRSNYFQVNSLVNCSWL